MKSEIRCLAIGVLFTFCLLSQSTYATVVVSVGQVGATNVDLGLAGGVKPVDFFIGQSAGGSDTLLAIVARYSLEAGTIGSPNGSIAAAGNTATPGFFGSTNLEISELLTDTSLNEPSLNERSFVVNQFFDDDQSLIMGGGERWFTLNINTNGLEPGEYSISLTNGDQAFQDFGRVLPVNNNLSFTISAIPEPGSLAVLTLLGVAVTARRRRCKAFRKPVRLA